MKDIPYGDNFSVEMRWDVKPNDDGVGCQILIHVAVPFIRSVLAPFRSMIESNVMKEMQESVKIMTEMLKVTLITLPEPEAEDPAPSESNDVNDTDVRSALVLSKLQNLLGHDEGLQKLEQIIGSTEMLMGKPTASLELPQMANVPVHQTTTTMNIQPSTVTSSTNWILFGCCLFMLFCQIMMVLMWLMWTPSNSGHVGSYDRLDGSLEQPMKHFYELEETLISIIHMLNTTLTQVQKLQ